MINLLVFGDSHVGALHHGHRPAIQRLGPVDFNLSFYGRHGSNWAEFEMKEADGRLHFFSDRLGDGRPVDFHTERLEDVYVFSSPLHSGPTCFNAIWNTYCPWDCVERHPELQPVSTAAIETWTAKQIKTRIDMLSMMKRMRYNIAVIEPPKPLYRTPALHGIPEDIIISSDKIYRNYVKNILSGIGVPIISAPEYTYADGFTTPEYSSGGERDPHHGNQKFGAAMMESVIQFAKSAAYS